MLSIKKVMKKFGEHTVLKNISLEISEGEIYSIIGPSGGGKSTILRVINGLETITEGTIEFNKIGLFDIAMVFQNFNLFNNMSVLSNITYPLTKVRKMSKAEAVAHATEALQIVGMAQLRNKMPSYLSGGQKQRAAIARAFANHPKLILFDEPTSALDPENVNEVLNTIRALAKKNIAMLIVTHEMAFAKEISDKIVFVEDGKILEVTPAPKFFKGPQTQRAKEFLAKIL